MEINESRQPRDGVAVTACVMRNSFLKAAVIATVVYLTATVSPLSAQQVGPSTTIDPYLLPAIADIKTASILTVGDLPAANGYKMVGIPDGLAVIRNGGGLFRLFFEVWEAMVRQDLKEALGFTVTNLLTFFVLLELFRSLVDYFREHRLKLTFIVDATLVFILRELMIGLYQHQSSPWQLAALGFLALVLGVLRTLAIVYSPMERRLVDQLHHLRNPQQEGRDKESRVQSSPSREIPDVIN